MDVVLTEGERTHSAYAELISHPPEGVRYVLKPMHWNAPVWEAPWRNRLEWKRRGAMHALHVAPDVANVPDWGAPVHATATLLKSPRPWLINFEHPATFVGLQHERMHSRGVAKRTAVLLRQPECKALVPWTDAAGRALAALVPDLERPMRTVYPAITPREPAAPEDPDAPLVLFVGRFFERKGGPEAVEAFVRARREHAPRARMLVVSDAGADAQARYEGEGVTFTPANKPRDEVMRIGFSKASAFVMPTHFDTFGMVFLEAFAHGLPVVTADTFAADEIVDDGKDGFIVRGQDARWFDERGLAVPGRGTWEGVRAHHTPEARERMVGELAERLGELLSDPGRAAEMGRRGREKVVNGKFSIGERNSRLKRIYDEAFGG